MNHFFQNKKIWIIGASSGIGKALAETFNSYNTQIIISSRNEDKLKEIQKNNKNIHIVTLDLLDFSNFKEKVDKVFSLFDFIDYIFFNGGTSFRGWISETDLKVHEKMMKLNYFSYIALTKEILPYLTKNRKGHLIITSSIMGKIGTPKRSAYAASKHALHGYFDCLRAEIAKDNINVTLLIPGHISTNISLNSYTYDGSIKGENSEAHEKGLEPAKAAYQIIKAIKNNKKEVYIGRKFNQEHLSLFVMRFFPNLLFKIVKNKIPE